MLHLQNISKSFDGTRALTDITINVGNGEVHALCGENGAGKSTLMNIITGNLRPDTGRIYLDGREVFITTVAQAQSLGIAIVYQERSLANALSVAENIFINPPLNRFGLISYPLLYQRTQELLDELHMSSISPKTLVDKLSPAQKQMVEIARALVQKPSLLILDEPTASLTHDDTATLFTIIRGLKQKGTTVIYISHRMPEIKEIADVVSILKDGCFQGSYNISDITTDGIIGRMVGRNLRQLQYAPHTTSEITFEVKDLTGAGFRNINFSLHRGEILGFAGLPGSGRTKLALSLFGDRPVTSGKMYKKQEVVVALRPSEAIRMGIAYIPDERKASGLFMDQSISDNLVSAKLGKGMFNSRLNDAMGKDLMVRFGIRSASVRQTMHELSGGNQQKVVLAKWLNNNPDVLIVNEPTHGVDVGAKEEIYKELKKMTAAGKSILLISSDLPELLLLSDRIAVMYNGVITTIIDHQDASEELITRLASGI